MKPSLFLKLIFTGICRVIHTLDTKSVFKISEEVICHRYDKKKKIKEIKEHKPDLQLNKSSTAKGRLNNKSFLTVDFQNVEK